MERINLWLWPMLNRVGALHTHSFILTQLNFSTFNIDLGAINSIDSNRISLCSIKFTYENLTFTTNYIHVGKTTMLHWLAYLISD